MFYCEKCRKEHNYPESMRKSFVLCEICNEKAACNDVPTSRIGSRKMDGD